MDKKTFNLSDAVLLTFAVMLVISLTFGADASPLIVDEKWLWLAVFVIIMLVQSLFTRFCLVAKVLKTLFPNLK